MPCKRVNISTADALRLDIKQVIDSHNTDRSRLTGFVFLKDGLQIPGAILTNRD